MLFHVNVHATVHVTAALQEFEQVFGNVALVTALFLKKDYIYGTLCDLVPFAQFKKREKHPWRSVAFSKVAGFSLQRY